MYINMCIVYLGCYVALKNYITNFLTAGKFVTQMLVVKWPPWYKADPSLTIETFVVISIYTEELWKM